MAGGVVGVGCAAGGVLFAVGGGQGVAAGELFGGVAVFGGDGWVLSEGVLVRARAVW